MADSPNTTNPSPPLSPDGLRKLAARLRAYSEDVIAHARPQQHDLRQAALAVERLAGLLRLMEQGNVTAVVLALTEGED
jgi:hypothetical protein